MIPAKQVVRDLAEVIAGCFRVRPDYNVWQWAEKNVFLDNLQAVGRPGNYDATRTPWNRRMQECDSDPNVEEVWVMKSSRSGVTEAFFNILRHSPAHDPGHLLYMLQNAKKVRNVANRRIIPSLKRCAKEFLTGDPDDLGKTITALINMELHFWGAGSESPFTEIAYKRIGIDEADEVLALIDDPEGESCADLARSRTRDVPGSKIYGFGKAKHRDGGALWLEYIGGTQEKYLLPCPFCNARIELHEGGFRYGHLKGDLVSDDVPGGYDINELLAGTTYECPACAKQIEERWKAEMAEAGEWHPTPVTADRCPPDQFFEVPEREGREFYVQPFSGRVSLRISDFYALHEKLRWGHFAEMLIEAETQPHRMRHIIINHTGKGWNEQEASVQRNEITALIGGRPDDEGKPRGITYRRGQCPIASPVMVAATGDVQSYGWRFLIAAWDASGGCWVMDWGTVLDNIGFGEILDQRFPVIRNARVEKWLGEVDGKPHLYFEETEGALPIRHDHVEHDAGCGLVDSRHKEADVFEYVMASNYRVFPSKGLGDVASVALVNGTMRTWNERGIRVKAYHYNDRAVQDRYSDCLKTGKPNQIYLPEDIDEDFISENSSMRFMAWRDKAGARRQGWKMVGEKNDLWDCMKKQVLLWHLVKDQRLAQWRGLGRDYTLD